MTLIYRSLRRKAQRRLECATVTSFYGRDLRYLQPGVISQDVMAALQEERGFIVEGPCMGDLLAAAGCPPEKIHVSPLGIDLSLFPPRQEHNTTHEVRVLTVGSFVEKKGIPDAISAVAQARRQGANLRLTVAGDGPLRPLIEGVVQREAAGLFVDLLGAVGYAGLRQLYYCHDLLLQPSLMAADGDTEGGAPVCIIEGMAAGLPVVATRHADIPNVVKEGGNGLLAEERHPEQLADLLCELACDARLRVQFSVSGRQRAEECFDYRKQSVHLEEIYDRILGA
jgi:colanic acid/amylovoran biosynthesis glycosyltransferase